MKSFEFLRLLNVIPETIKCLNCNFMSSIIKDKSKIGGLLYKCNGYRSLWCTDFIYVKKLVKVYIIYFLKWLNFNKCFLLLYIVPFFQKLKHLKKIFFALLHIMGFLHILIWHFKQNPLIWSRANFPISFVRKL